MTTKEKLQQASDELIEYIEKITADVPPLTDEEVADGIKKVLDRIYGNNL